MKNECCGNEQQMMRDWGWKQLGQQNNNSPMDVVQPHGGSLSARGCKPTKTKLFLLFPQLQYHRNNRAAEIYCYGTYCLEL